MIKMACILFNLLMCYCLPLLAQPGSSTEPVSLADSISIGLLGDPGDVHTTTQYGIVLMGGSTDVDEAFRWMIKRSGGGDFIILRASGSTGYNAYIKNLGDVNSVETLLINSRTKAMQKEVGQRIREAEAVFIAGGDQWNYVNFWRGTEVSSALRFLLDEKKVPLGGTSAGCAVLSDIIFDAQKGGVTSTTALNNPYDTLVSLSKSFISVPLLKNTIADQHYVKRDRLGRHVAFMARMITDFSVPQPKGIGVDEKTAVCIDQDGNAIVMGSGEAYFLISHSVPEKCKPGEPLQWNKNNYSIRAFIIQGTEPGAKTFNLSAWPATGEQERWYVEAGELHRVKY